MVLHSTGCGRVGHRRTQFPRTPPDHPVRGCSAFRNHNHNHNHNHNSPYPRDKRARNCRTRTQSHPNHRPFPAHLTNARAFAECRSPPAAGISLTRPEQPHPQGGANARAVVIRAHNRTPDTDQSPRSWRTRAHSRNVEHRTAASAYPISTRPPPTTAAGISPHPRDKRARNRQPRSQSRPGHPPFPAHPTKARAFADTQG